MSSKPLREITPKRKGWLRHYLAGTWQLYAMMLIPIIYIICEGKETETLYFKHFRSRNCLVDIIPISSKHKAAEHLVKHAKSLISQADYYPKDGDQLWCVFDCDDNKDSELQAAVLYG